MVFQPVSVYMIVLVCFGLLLELVLFLNDTVSEAQYWELHY